MNVVAVIIVLAVLGVGGYSLSIYYILHPVDRIEYKYIENNECSHLINSESDFVTCGTSNGNSMNYPNGSLHLYIEPENIEVGDVIVFYPEENKSIIHRVVDIYEEENITYYTTKGDNNNRTDDYKVIKDMIKYECVATLYMKETNTT